METRGRRTQEDTERRVLRGVAATAWLVALAAITLLPQPVTRLDPGMAQLSACLLCGDFGLADALLNVLLFTPLRLLLPGGRGVLVRAALTGLALSASIEVAQHFIPGRYSNLGDITWNTAGAWLGAVAWRLRGRWIPGGPREASHLGAAAACGVFVVTAAFGWLLAPAWPRAQYWGQWTPDLGFLEVYRGRVLDARLDTLRLPSGRFPDDLDPRRLLSGDWVLRVRVTKGPPPGSLAPVVSIFDGAQREVLLVGVAHEDMVYRERSRARMLLLGAPDLRVAGALATVAPGDTMHLAIERRGRGRCLSIGNREDCPGFTPGRAWSLLFASGNGREAMLRAMDALWMGLLLLPVGLWSPRFRNLLARGGAALAGCVAAVLLTRLVLPPWYEGVGAVLGLVIGHALRHVAASVLTGEGRDPGPA